MKAWQKIVAFLSVATMITAVAAGCGATDTNTDAEGDAATPETSAAESTADESAAPENGDWDEIAAKGTMVVGYTINAPMNFEAENGDLTGFETEFTKAVCEKLNVEPEFVLINWESKEMELNAKTIDCIWNGMTITDERKANMDVSIPYLTNEQALVVQKDKLDAMTSVEDLMNGATVVAEKESAGEELIEADKAFEQANYTPVEAQIDALREVNSFTADAAVIDATMASYLINSNSDFANLAIVPDTNFEAEEYGIAFRKNSPVTLQKVEDAMQQLENEGKLAEIAEKYGLTDRLLVKPAE